MILLVVFAFLVLPLNARFDNNNRVHVSDTLRMKCDNLLYRSAYIGNRCYFAVFREVTFSEAASQCSSIFPGSKVATTASDAVFNSMMIDKSKFHVGASSGAKRTICVFEHRLKCDQGTQSTIIPGKCVARADTKNSFEMAEKFCADMGMQVPVVGNDLENKMIRNTLGKSDAWIRNVYVKPSWRREKNYGRFDGCPRQNAVLLLLNNKRSLFYDSELSQLAFPISSNLKISAPGGNLTTVCMPMLSAVINKAGYWQKEAQHVLFDAVCVGNAGNDFVKTAVAIRKSKPTSCIKHHAFDRAGECGWTGPKDACAQLIDFYNRTWFTPMPNFPRETFTEIRLDIPHNQVADVSVKVIVRKGCMFFGYMHPKSGDNPLQEAVSVSHRLYGEHKVPCQLTGELTDIYDGISRVNCFCDPTEATLNGHVPAPPPGKQCIEHHEYNEDTKQCEWQFESKYCGELVTNDGRRQKLEIPNWPVNRRYDVDHYNTKRAEVFHITVTEIIVRQHCWATLYWRGHHERLTLATSGYGKHKVASFYNGLLKSPEDGTHRVVCECIG